ncbi:MAG TPA: ketol-acid reductoisomerase, partial [Thermodesulfobacteriota bacterium]|nr:ketol-acid reductoisomerase [Thermodesulfobacteriota bacterium]
MVKIYYEKDANIKPFKERTIAVIGYGSQGRAQALNIRDSGVNVIIGLRKGGKSWPIAEKDGFEIVTPREAVKNSGVILMLAQDDVQPKIYRDEIEPHLKKGIALAFSHGFNIHFGQIIPPREVDVYMIAPKSPGDLLRRMFTQGKGVPCLLAIHQDPSGKVKEIALAHAKAIGGTRAGVIETTFEEETESDLAGEQIVLCGGVTQLIKAGFEALVEA